jgi:molybdenum cofactor synthesis domain-containing protein
VTVFRKLFSIEEAKEVLHKAFLPKPVGIEKVSLSEALNRVLAEDIVASMDVPPFARSTVDGYAVKSEDTFGAEENHPVALNLCGSVSIGESPSILVRKGFVSDIVTGAPIPLGADAVVMMEQTVHRGDIVLIYSPVSKGENVMKAGSDIHKGEMTLRKGQTISYGETGILASLGLTEITVYKKPLVAIISTGREIVEPGKPLLAGKIYDINAYTLSAAVTDCGGEPVRMGILPDEADRLKPVLEKALGSADLVMTSGGVSVGPTDIIPTILEALGKPGVIVHGIAIKPGKPVTIAVIREKPVFSLPGHPTSSLLTFHILVRPILRAMAGRTQEAQSEVKAIAGARMFSAKGRRTFIMVNVVRDETERKVASPVPANLSGAITTLAKADGYVEIPENEQFVDTGEEVTVHLFKSYLSSSLKERSE